MKFLRTFELADLTVVMLSIGLVWCGVTLVTIWLNERERKKALTYSQTFLGAGSSAERRGEPQKPTQKF